MAESPTAKLQRASVGIITALDKELVAVIAAFQCDVAPVFAPGEGASRKYYLADVPTLNGGTIVVAVSSLIDMGNNFSAIQATKMCADCHGIRNIIMTGIAGAVPNFSKADEHVRLGDIVVSNIQGVLQYDLKKETDANMEIRVRPDRPSAELLEAVKSLRREEMFGRRPWVGEIAARAAQLGEEWIRPDPSKDRCADTFLDGNEETPVVHPDDPKRTEGEPRIFLGMIASSNAVLKKALLRDQLRDEYQIKAIEMEGAGIADAAWIQRVGYLIVRGTCDYCDRYKQDDWQEHAAVIAAVFTRCIVTHLDGTAPVTPPPDTAPGTGAGIAQSFYGCQIDSVVNNHITYGVPAVEQAMKLVEQTQAERKEAQEKYERELAERVRLETRLEAVINSTADPAPNEHDLATYKQHATELIARMQKARMTYEYDGTTKLVEEAEPWLVNYKPHLPPELFDEAWWELIYCERFRQDYTKVRSGKWDRAALDRMKKQFGDA